MFSSIVWPTWGELFHGEVTFKQIGEMIGKMFSELVGHSYFLELNKGIMSYVQSFVLPILAALAVLSLVFALFGRKLLPIARFLGFFALGFLVGVSLIAPILTAASFNVMPLIIGLIMGVLLAVFSKFLYILIYIVAFAYSSYMIFMGGQLLPESVVSFTKGNMVISLFAVCITVVLVVILKKPVEIIGTSILGGYLFSLSVDGILYKAFAVERIAVLSVILMVVVALLGFIKQVRTKKSKNAIKIRKAKKSD
jgi:hypothetical protein